MFHYKLIELESELLAKEQSQKGFVTLPPECVALIEFVEREIGVKLSSVVPSDWRGWLSYRRNQQSLVVSRGRTFKDGGLFAKHKAGLDIPHGLDAVTEYQRGFDVSPPQDLDHLLINFGGTEKSANVFLWYGENFAPYRLIFQAEVSQDPHHELASAVVEACTWIMKRPKEKTLAQFLIEIAKSNQD